MRLLELHPKWIHPHMFAFVCPHCRNMLLTCKTAFISRHEQYELFERMGGWRARHIVPSKPEANWRVEGDWTNLTVTPSIDASASGHWHGHITNGQIVGGVIL